MASTLKRRERTPSRRRSRQKSESARRASVVDRLFPTLERSLERKSTYVRSAAKPKDVRAYEGSPLPTFVPAAALVRNLREEMHFMVPQASVASSPVLRRVRVAGQ